jgi:PPOX class probable F420-dependent enzyme
MTNHEVNSFLASNPARPGTLATTRVDGRPHVAPVWFVTDDNGDIVFNTGRDTVKGRNLARTLFAALCVQDDRAPYSFVAIEGPVVLSEDLGEVGRWATIIGGRRIRRSERGRGRASRPTTPRSDRVSGKCRKLMDSVAPNAAKVGQFGTLGSWNVQANTFSSHCMSIKGIPRCHDDER